MTIDERICLRARGIAILMIVLHDFAHLIPGRFVRENEMTFFIDYPFRLYVSWLGVNSAALFVVHPVDSFLFRADLCYNFRQ